MGRYITGGQRGYFYFVSKDGKNLNVEQVLALLNGEIVSTVELKNFNGEQSALIQELTAQRDRNAESVKLLGEWVDKLKGELEEQCRLNGMGSEREAKLLADKARLEKMLLQYRVELKPSVVFAGKGDEPLSAERKAQLKGTIFEHCETENEVTARHFDAMS